MPRAWTADEIRDRGFDPLTGARLAARHPQSRLGPELGERRESGTVKLDRPLRGDASGRQGVKVPTLSSYARSRLTPEQRLQVAVVEEIRPRLVPGAKLIAINGELPGGSRMFRMWQAVRRAMGYERGTPDLAVMRAGRVYLIELKRPRGEPDLFGHRKARGELSDEQREWRRWAKEHDCPWLVARSVTEVADFLAVRGLIAG